MPQGAAAVLFDMSGVIFTNGTRLLVRQLAHETRATPAELERLFSGPQCWALRRGEIPTEQFWRETGSQLAGLTALAPEEIRQRWLDAFVPQDGMIRLLAELASAGIPLGAVAETTEERTATLAARWSHETFLLYPFYSFRHGLDKRDGRLFELAARELLPASLPVYMIEDDESSAAHAAALGFKCILFESADRLRSDFIRFGVLQPSRVR